MGDVDGTADGEGGLGWSVRSERERLMASCPAEAAALAEAELRAPRPHGLAGEVLSRQELGLRADQAYLQELHRAFDVAGPDAAQGAAVSGGSGGWSTTWGFLMTENEERGLWKRQAGLRSLVEAAQALVDSLRPDLAGGVWQELGADTVVVSLTAEADVRGVLGDLRAVARPGQHVRAVRTRWSTSQLRATRETVARHTEGRWNGHGTDVRSGAVTLMVPADVDGVRRAVSEVADPCAVYVYEGHPVALST